MRRLHLLSSPSLIVIAFLSIATHHCRDALALGSTIDFPDENIFALEDQQQDLFSSNTIFHDSSSSINDIATSQEENIWASTLQPIDNADEYVPADGAVSSSSAISDDSFLSSADYQSSACLAEDPSIFGRSDDNVIAATTPDFCFQKPSPGEENLPPLSFPNPFDLLQPDDQNDLLAPFDTFPRRPVCPGLNPMYVLCCKRDREVEDGFAWDCEKCRCKKHIILNYSVCI